MSANWEFRANENGRNFRLFHRHGNLLIYIMNASSFCQICEEKVPPGIQIQAKLIDYMAWNDSGFSNIVNIIDDYPPGAGIVTVNLISKRIENFRKELHPEIAALLREYKIW